jgi:hypothetical protein
MHEQCILLLIHLDLMHEQCILLLIHLDLMHEQCFFLYTLNPGLNPTTLNPKPKTLKQEPGFVDLMHPQCAFPQGCSRRPAFADPAAKAGGYFCFW